MLLRVLTASLLAAAAMWGAPPPADADSCSLHCDATCTTCCPEWTVRASCGSDERSDGSFATYGEALDAASRANDLAATCTDASAACSAAKMSCMTGSKGLAQWQPACAGAGITPANAELAAKALADGRHAEDAAKTASTESSAGISTFVHNHVLTKAGEGATATVSESIESARRSLEASMAQGELLRARGAGPGDALTAWRADVDRSVKAVGDAKASLETLMHDPSAVNAAADEKKRLAREEMQARRSKVSLLQKTASSMTAEIASTQTALGESLTNVQPARQKQGASLQRALQTELDGWTALTIREASAAAAEAPSAAQVSELGRRSDSLGKQTEQTVSGATAFMTNAAAPAVEGAPAKPSTPAHPSPTAPAAPVVVPVAVEAPAVVALSIAHAPPTVPTCTVAVALASTERSAKASVSIDGRFVSVPGDVKLSSGRHTVVARSGSATKQSSELVLCNRTKTLNVEVPR